MPETHTDTIDRIVQRTTPSDWTFLNVENEVVTYLPFGGPEIGETYARAWNDCALRAGRLDLVIVVAVFRSGETTLTAPAQFLPQEGGEG